MKGASPHGAHLWLHAKPLDAAIGQVTTPHCPGGRHGRRFRMKHKNTNKTKLLSSFLTVDRRKKAKWFRDLKQTLYSCHQCNKLRTNVKCHHSNWRAQLHFELSNVVNGQKFKKILTLNKALNKMWAKYGPRAVKPLMEASNNICARPPSTWVAWIHRIHAARGASFSITMVVVFVVCLCRCGLTCDVTSSSYVKMVQK